MRIALMVRSLGFGGAERQAILLARALSDAGHEVSVLVFYAGQGLESELQDSGVELIDLRKRGRRDLFSFLGRVARAVVRLRPDVLYSFLPGPNLLASVMRPLLPRARIALGIRNSSLDVREEDRLSVLVHRVEPFVGRLASVAISNSLVAAHDAIDRGYPAHRVVVVPNGIDSSRFRPNAAFRAKTRERWGVVGDVPIIGRIGRLHPMKGFDAFIDAASLVARRHRTCEFVCMGEGASDYRAQLQARSAANGLGDRIHWFDPAADMERIYPALDLLVSTSRYGEGFPNVVAEGMACGVPALVTDSGDSSLVVGDAGWLLPVTADADQIAVEIERALERIADARSDVSRQARERMVTEFSVDLLLSRTLSAVSR